MEWNNTHRKSLDNNACLILDDCDADFKDLKWDKNKNFKFLFRSAKSANVTLIFTSAYPLKMQPHFYSAIDYVFLLHEPNKKHQRDLFNMFGGMFDDVHQFADIMGQCTRDYGCVVIDRTREASAEKLQDCVSWYRAPSKLQKYYMCSKSLWNLCYDENVSLDEIMTRPFLMFTQKK